jgi:membrane protease YdiL (CAAX protease family)
MNINIIKSIKYFFQKNTIIFLISIFPLIIVLWILLSNLLNPIQGQCVTVVIVLVGIWLFGYLDKLGFRRINTLKGLQYTAIVLLGSLYSLILSIVYVKRYELYIPGIYRIVSIIFQMLGAGFFEEILFRGILLNIIIYKFRKKNKGIYYAVIITSILFGLSHLINLINRPHILNGIISQVIYSTIMGMVYSIVYIHYKNIFPIIITHTLFNLMSIFPFIFLRVNYWMITDYFMNLHNKLLIVLFDSMLAILCFFYVLYLFNKLKVNKKDKMNGRVYCA